MTPKDNVRLPTSALRRAQGLALCALLVLASAGPRGHAPTHPHDRD